MKTTKGHGYTVTAELMLALPPLFLALPAAGAPCDPKGASAPVPRQRVQDPRRRRPPTGVSAV